MLSTRTRILGFSLLLVSSLALTEPAEAPRFSDLASFAQSQNLATPGAVSVESLVANLPPSLAGLFDDYALMTSSNSNQVATPELPRVVTFGGGANLIVAYGGSGRTIEATEWNPTTKRWNFYEIDVSSGNAVVSSANPAKCVRCHTTSFRPNWEAYASWPGAVGENEFMTDEEHARFGAWADSVANHPRYRRLAHLKSHYDRAPYDPQFTSLPEPNTRFTIALARRNFERLANGLRGEAAYESLKFALAAAAVPGCVVVDENQTVSLPFLPEGSRLRIETERRLSEMFKAQQAARLTPQGIETAAILTLLEVAGMRRDLRDVTLSEDPRRLFTTTVPRVLYKDPLAHGLGGGEKFLEWGLAQVDPEIGRFVTQHVRPAFTYRARPGETPAQALVRRNSQALINASPALPRTEYARVCAALTPLSLRASAAFQLPATAPGTRSWAAAPAAIPSH